MAESKNTEAQALLAQASQLLARGALREAIQVLRKAATIDPENAAVHGQFARAACRLAQQAPQDEANALLGLAQDAAFEALGILPTEQAATEALRVLSAYTVPYAPCPEALQPLMAQGTEHYGKGEFAEAARCYDEVLRQDPGNYTAVKYLGNCHYGARRPAEAEALFRRATELNPLDPQAHRFLADALEEQGKIDQIWDPSYAAVAAQPNHWSAWLDLSRRRALADRPLRRFRPRPAAWYSRDAKSGQVSLVVNPSAPSHVAAAWMCHASAQIAPPQGAPETPFQAACRAWKTMGTFIAESLQNDPSLSFPDDLLAVKALATSADPLGIVSVEAMVFLLRYSEAYRAEFEAWKNARDDKYEAGFRAFMSAQNTPVGPGPLGPVHRPKMFLMGLKLRPF